MEHRRFGSDCVIRIQKGEEILAALRQVCTQENIVLASVNGIGAVNDVTLGVFNSKKFVYESTRYTGDMEIVSCMGNVTQKDGEVYLHLHMAVANATKGVVYAGHLNDAKISLTGEFILRIIDGRVEREYSPEVVDVCLRLREENSGDRDDLVPLTEQIVQNVRQRLRHVPPHCGKARSSRRSPLMSHTGWFSLLKCISIGMPTAFSTANVKCYERKICGKQEDPAGDGAGDDAPLALPHQMVL